MFTKRITENLKFLLIACLTGIPGNTSGDIIRGKITDAENGNPLESVKISLQNNPQVSSFTNSSGMYTLNTDISGIMQSPSGGWSSLSALQNFGKDVSIQVRNVKGVLIGKIEPAFSQRNFKQLFLDYPKGLYVISVKVGTTINHFLICKLGNNTFLVQNTFGGSSIFERFSEETPSRAENTLLYTKLGYRDTSKKVNGSQDNIDLLMKRGTNCGNGVVEIGEICDGNTRPCNLINPMKYAQGDGPCDNTCSGFTLTACVEHPVTDVSGNPNGTSYRRAAEITGLAQLNVIFRTKAGMLEGDIQVIIDSVFKANNFGGLAFPHITGSGPNSLDLHYMGKTRKLVDGDVMVVDIGAKFNEYCGDITRTYPVSGKFTPRQREVYQLVLDAGKAAAAAMKPNQQSLSQMTTFAKDFFRKSPLRAKDKTGVERTMDVFFIHSLSHYIGKNVHGTDLGFSTSEPVKPGRVFSVEPGLYIDSEGFGIRLEDDYLMTDKGAVNIFPNTPIEAAHIEALMALRVLLPEVAHYQETGGLPQADKPARNDHMDF